MPHDVFISYSSKDRLIADALCQAMEQEGIRCWIASRNIQSGEIFAKAIIAAIESCKVMVLVFSLETSLSDYVLSEVSTAFDEKKVIIPFKIEDAQFEGAWRLLLGKTHWHEAFPPPAQKHFQTIIDAVKNNIGGMPSEEKKSDFDRKQFGLEENQSALIEEEKKPNFEEKKPEDADNVISTIHIGDYMQMGNYLDEPILWRCVLVDENGPLMLSDKILCFKPFDASGNHKYSDGTAQAEIAGPEGIHFGSSLWETSNIRSWLNSDAAAGDVKWIDGCPPTASAVYDGYNAYATERGFLSYDNFSSGERNAIKSVMQKSLLNQVHIKKLRTGGTSIHSYNTHIDKIVQNYDTACYHNVTDKVFLLDVKQINQVYRNSDILGANYYIGKPSDLAIVYSEIKHEKLSADNYCLNYLRTPYAVIDNIHAIGCNVRVVDPDGRVEYGGASSWSCGIRPAFYIDLLSVIFKSGNGLGKMPYILDEDTGRHVYQVRIGQE